MFADIKTHFLRKVGHKIFEKKNKNMAAIARYKEQLLCGLSRILPGRVKYSTTNVPALELNHPEWH